MSKVIDMTGQKYGKLYVIERAENDKHEKAQWLCQCDCGSEPKIINGSAIRKGLVVSCGCNKKEKLNQYHKARFDFAIFEENSLKYFIEFDGLQHFEKNIRENGFGWNNRQSYEKVHERDLLKNQWCKENNIPLIRIPYTHLKNLCLNDLLLETTTYKI